MNWYQKTPATGPNLQAYGAVYDSARGVVVFAGGLLGGITGGQSTTYEWDGYCLKEITTAHFPTGGRYLPAIAYDKARAKTVLFGGFEDVLVDQDTWTYNGTDWTQVFPAHKPSYRSTSMVYDEVNHVIVLFGGSDGSSQLGDTWLWNGTDWTEVFPAHSPPPCGDGMMLAWDPINSKVVFFGGNSPYFDTNETWTWDGTDWTHESPATSPPGRRYGAFGGISGVGAVLYGCFSEPGIIGTRHNLYDTWLWTGTDWVNLDPVDHPSEGFGQNNQNLVQSPVGGGAVFFVGGMIWDWTPNPAPGRWLYATSFTLPDTAPPFASPDQFVYKLLDAYTGELYVLADVWICQSTIDALTFDESDVDQNLFGVADWYGEADHVNPFPPVDWCQLGNVSTLFLAGDAPSPVAPYWETAFTLSPRLDITAGLHTIGIHVSIPHLTATIVVDDHAWSSTISGFQSQIDAIYFGAQAAGCFGNTADPITNMTNIRVGTTCWGSTDIIFDNFETNDFSKWDGVQGTPHIIPRPICIARDGTLPMFHSGPHFKPGQNEPAHPIRPPARRTLYAALGSSATTSALYTVDSYTGAMTAIGPIGFALTGLAMDPTTGILYGVTNNNSAAHPQSLISINTTTGAGTFIGAYNGTHGGVQYQTFTDICFASNGTLYAQGQHHSLLTINKTTAASALVSAQSGVNFGGGITADSADTLFASPFQINPPTTVPPFAGTFLQIANKTTGVYTNDVLLLGQPVLNESMAALAMDQNDVLYGVLTDRGATRYDLVTVSSSGAIVVIGALTALTDALAWATS